MPVIKGLEWTFNTEAEKYEKMRPGYVSELYEDIFELLGTYSDHIAIEENIRNKFFSEIEEAIDNLDGQITIYDTIDLQLA